MTKREDLLGWEFDWFGVDGDNHVGHFSSAGYGPIPLQILENVESQRKLLDYFTEIPGNIPAMLVTLEEGDHGDWLNVAKHGLFSYDFKVWDGPYILIARPEEPQSVDTFPPHIQAALVNLRFEDICFEDIYSIAPEKFFSCERG